jgi:hypothetical protein
VSELSRWATDITRLTLVNGAPTEPISHAVGLDFPHCF